jgi:hypothetical protein
LWECLCSYAALVLGPLLCGAAQTVMYFLDSSFRLLEELIHFF